MDEEERRLKEEEEEKFDIAALLAKAKTMKGKFGFGYNAKRHYSTLNKIEEAKRKMKSRHSFTAMPTIKKSMGPDDIT